MPNKSDVIAALKSAADGILNLGVTYDWNSPYSCNVGVFLQYLLQLYHPAVLKDLMFEGGLTRGHSWSTAALYESNAPFFTHLREQFGITPEFLSRIEVFAIEEARQLTTYRLPKAEDPTDASIRSPFTIGWTETKIFQAAAGYLKAIAECLEREELALAQ